MNKNLIEALEKRDYISYKEVIFKEINETLEKTAMLIAKLNEGYKKQEEVREILEEMTGRRIDKSTTILLPFNSDFGARINFGKDIFINKGCMFVDLGGIELEDNVLIGPEVKILSVNHPIDVANRRDVILKGVKVKKNAWIGAGATICPGVTIGENSIIGAGSVVTKNVPSNTVYAGVPAKFIKNIADKES
ncbi:MAG: DapH/DapD/GlmU-related protein [Clostridium sp.]|uniref:DapH/DapD/GlmU-related protein n=1 Tax=Clostridium sp. TaxID=1506 RepID=UPI003EE4601C